MNTVMKYGFLLGLVAVLASCADSNRPNYQFFPNMYESVSYEPYQQVEFLPGTMEAMEPVDGTIARGYMPYKFSNSPEDRALAKLDPSPLDSLNMEKNLKVGKELYDIYCAVCHGKKGDGNGILVEREKILGVPSYGDAGREITVGGTYHTIYYGLNSMGSYANQLNPTERWQVAEYVVKLKNDLK